MAQLGVIDDADPWVKDRKLTIQIEIGSDSTPDYEALDESIKEFGSKAWIQLIVNGKIHRLSDKSTGLIRSNYKVLKAIFGDYYWSGGGRGSKKILTKSKNGPAVMDWMAKTLVNEPQELRDTLARAATQKSWIR
jgi:hypothetical protein